MRGVLATGNGLLFLSLTDNMHRVVFQLPKKAEMLLTSSELIGPLSWRVKPLSHRETFNSPPPGGGKRGWGVAGHPSLIFLIVNESLTDELNQLTYFNF